MSRDLKLNIVVDDHGAAQKLHEVADAEDHVTASAAKASDPLDIFGKRHAALASAAGQSRGALLDLSGAADTFSVSTTDADQILSDLHVSLQAMPSTLSQVREGLNGLGDGLGLTVESLGALTTAGVVAGTAMVSWNLGRHIAEWTGLDDIVARNAATLFGWGNVAAQEAGAKADVLARASQFAGREITNLSEAMDINQARAVAEQDHWDALAIAINRANAAQRQQVDNARELEVWGRKVEAQFDRERAALAAYTAETDRWREKVHAIEHDGDHAFTTLHQWYGELQRDQKYVNELADQNIKKFEASQRAAAQFLIDALNAAKAIDAELGLIGPIGHGPSVPNDGSPLNPRPITVRPIGPIAPPPGDTRGGIVTGQNTNTTIPAFAMGGPTGSGGLALLHPNEFVVPQGGALVKSGGSTIIVNIDATSAVFEDDRALDRLVDKLSDRLGVRAVQRGAIR